MHLLSFGARAHVTEHVWCAYFVRLMIEPSRSILACIDTVTPIRALHALCGKLMKPNWYATYTLPVSQGIARIRFLEPQPTPRPSPVFGRVY